MGLPNRHLAFTEGDHDGLCKSLILLAHLDLLILQMSQKHAVCWQKCGTSETIEKSPNGK
jgi:hypothetical protein